MIIKKWDVPKALKEINKLVFWISDFKDITPEDDIDKKLFNLSQYIGFDHNDYFFDEGPDGELKPIFSFAYHEIYDMERY